MKKYKENKEVSVTIIYEIIQDNFFKNKNIHKKLCISSLHTFSYRVRHNLTNIFGYLYLAI